jgi:hypothetical protein
LILNHFKFLPKSRKQVREKLYPNIWCWFKSIGSWGWTTPYRSTYCFCFKLRRGCYRWAIGVFAGVGLWIAVIGCQNVTTNLVSDVNWCRRLLHRIQNLSGCLTCFRIHMM